MEKPEKPAARPSRGKNMMRYLPRAATFSVPTKLYSPGHVDRRVSTDTAIKPSSHNKGFSGPISIIPAEARMVQRRERRRGSLDDDVNVGLTAEPTSPKVSCIGTVKHKKAICRMVSTRRSSSPKKKEEEEKKSASSSSSALTKLFRRKAKAEKKPSSAAVAEAEAVTGPPLGQLRRFSSGRNTLAGFDWKAHLGTPVEPVDSPVGYVDESDEEGGVFGRKEECLIPHSAPMVVGGGELPPAEAKKEVNLWKRRTMAPPRPLQLHVRAGSS